MRLPSDMLPLKLTMVQCYVNLTQSVECWPSSNEARKKTQLILKILIQQILAINQVLKTTRMTDSFFLEKRGNLRNPYPIKSPHE